MDLNEIFATKRSQKQIEMAARLIIENPVLIDKLLFFLATNDKELNQKAAQTFHKITDINKNLLARYQMQLLPVLKISVHISVKRCVLRLFSQIGIDNEIAGQVVDECFNFLTENNQPTAIKVFAMTTIAAIAQRYPELMQELRPILEEQMPYASAGFKSRAGKILNGTYKFN